MCELEMRIGRHVVDGVGNVFVPELGLALNYLKEAERHSDRTFKELLEIVRNAQTTDGVPTSVVQGLTYQVIPGQQITRNGSTYTLVSVIPQSAITPS